MTFVLHEEVAKRFNERAEQLFSRLTAPPERSRQETAAPEFFVKAHVTEEDLVGKPCRGEVDITGSEVARYFFFDGQWQGLQGEDYRELLELAEAIQQTGELRAYVSTGYVIRRIFEWIEGRVTGSADSKMTDALLPLVEEDVANFEVWIVLYGTTIQSECKIGPVCICPIRQGTLDRWFQKTPKSADDSAEAREAYKTFVERTRGNIQGYAAAVSTIRAEESRAIERAIEQTEEAISCLRLWSPGTVSARAQTRCRVHSTRVPAALECYLVQDGDMKFATQQSNRSAMMLWKVSDSHISIMRQTYLNDLSRILNTTARSELEKAVLNAVMVHSRAALVDRPEEKLTFVFAALESLLLRSENEPVTQNIADRVSFLVGRSATERQALATKIKSVYGKRSKFLHHGRPISELEEIDAFLDVAVHTTMTIVRATGKYRSKDELLAALDGMKYS